MRFCLTVICSWLLLVSAVSCGFQSLGNVEDLFWSDSIYLNQYHRYLKRKISAAKSHFGRSSVELAHSFPPSPASCNTCKSLTQIAVDVLADPALTNLTLAVADAVCKRATNNSADYKLCVTVADVVDYVAQRALIELNKLSWNVPVSVCADVLKLCKIDCCTSNTTAEQFHLAFADENAVSNSSSLAVMWTMRHWNPNVTLQWRAVGATLWINAATGEASTYTIGGWLGWNYRSFMTGLVADTAYEYRVVDGTEALSQVFTTRTAPLNIGSDQRPMRVLALADMGWHAVSDDTVAQMTRLVDEGKVDFVLHYGDIGYADGNEEDWDLFMRKIEPIASRVPYMTTPGNHECLWNFTAYRSRLTMMVAPGQPIGAMWYGFHVGGVRFLMLDSESWINTPEVKPAELQWVISALTNASLAGEAAVVTMHRPLYCTSPGADCGMWSAFLRDAIETPLNQPAVLMVHAGHLHNYERTFPVSSERVVTRNYSNPSAPLYVVNGAAGNKEGQSPFAAAAPWTAFRSTAIGFVTMEFATVVANHDSTDGILHVETKFHDAASQDILDSFNVTKHVTYKQN